MFRQEQVRRCFRVSAATRLSTARLVLCDRESIASISSNKVICVGVCALLFVRRACRRRIATAGRLRVMMKSSVGKRAQRQVALVEEGEIIGCEGAFVFVVVVQISHAHPVRYCRSVFRRVWCRFLVDEVFSLSLCRSNCFRTDSSSCVALLTVLIGLTMTSRVRPRNCQRHHPRRLSQHQRRR